MTTELETLIPQPLTLELAGKTLEILPLPIGRLGGMMQVLKPVIAEFIGDEVNVLALATDHPDALMKAVSTATGEPLEWVSGLNLADFVRLAGSIWEVNRDFFTRRVKPEIDRLTTPQAGVTPSNA